MRQRKNLIAGLTIFVVALVPVLRALGLLSDGIYDLLLRAWPALLILAGLGVLLGSRIRFGSALALLIVLLLTGGVAVLAFSTRIEQQRDDYRETIAQEVAAEVTLLRVRVSTLTTDVELLRGPPDARVIEGTFTGSRESEVLMTYVPEGAVATLTIDEQQPSPFPMLEDLGRGQLRVELPPDVPLDVEVLGTDGDVLLNLSGLAVERLNLDLQSGDSLVTLPVYRPLGTPPGEPQGTLAVRNGDISLFIPAEVSARLELERGSGLPPIYDPTVYNALFNNTVLEARNIDTAEIVARYVIIVPNGQIEVRVP